MTGRNRVWTPAQVDTMEAMMASGYSARLVGEEFECSRNSVLGAIFRKRNPYQPRPKMPRAKPKWHNEALRMRADGLLLKQIAHVCGVSVPAVSRVCSAEIR